MRTCIIHLGIAPLGVAAKAAKNLVQCCCIYYYDINTTPILLLLCSCRQELIYYIRTT